jgi:hypothetical protein
MLTKPSTEEHHEPTQHTHIDLYGAVSRSCAALGRAVGRQETLKEQLVGAWTYVSVDTVRPDGSRVPMFGPNPNGLARFDSNGRYILLTARAGQSKFASNNHTEGTPEEYSTGRTPRATALTKA